MWLVVLIRILKWLVVKGYSFLWTACSCKASPLTHIQFTQVKCMLNAFNAPYLHFCLSIDSKHTEPRCTFSQNKQIRDLNHPLVNEHAIVSILGWQTPLKIQQPSLPEMSPLQGCAVFSKPVYAARIRFYCQACQLSGRSRWVLNALLETQKYAKVML